MELIDRYLQAVKFWLPENQKEDIAAELSEDIDAQIAEREVQLGRSLNEAEVETILEKVGGPVVVANRYLPPKQLIGPLLFPVYRFVLKIALAAVLAPLALTWVGLAIYGRAAIGSVWGSLWMASLMTFGVVTAVFAVLERVGGSRMMDEWSPRKLPPVRNPNLIPRAGSVIELAINLGLLIFWASNMYSPSITFYPGFHVTLAPVWSYFFWGYLLTCCSITVLAAVNLWHPYWTVQRAVARLVTNGVGSALLCWLLKANIVTGFASPDLSAARALDLVRATNAWLDKLFPAGVVMVIVIALADGYRIWRLSQRRGTIGSPAALRI